MTNKTIVFVDDDPDSRVTAQRATDRLGCEFLFFERIADVFDSIGFINPKLIVLDMAMANLNGVYDQKAGIEICAALRTKYADRFPILVLSGTESPPLVCECLRSGADDFCLKSDRITGLVKRIAAWLVVNYRVANPKQKREAAAFVLEGLIANLGTVAVKEWLKSATSVISSAETEVGRSQPTSGSLRDLFAW